MSPLKINTRKYSQTCVTQMGHKIWDFFLLFTPCHQLMTSEEILSRFWHMQSKNCFHQVSCVAKPSQNSIKTFKNLKVAMSAREGAKFKNIMPWFFSLILPGYFSRSFWERAFLGFFSIVDCWLMQSAYLSCVRRVGFTSIWMSLRTWDFPPSAIV